MSGKSPGLSPLESRKQLLVAESEINRLQMQEEWQAMTGGIHGIARRVKSIRALASAAAAFVAGVSSFQRGKSADAEARPSWFQTALKGVQLAGSVWQEFRARSR